jgi:hypothetical protein
VKISVADCDGSHPADLEPRLRVVDSGLTATMRFADGQYVYNISGKSLPDPRGTYRVEITLPNGQVVTTSFRLKPRLLGELGGARLPDDGHLDLPGVFELVLDLPGDLV